MAGQTPGEQFTSPETPAAGGLHPIGVFWDIENCQVPKGKSATAVVRSIRQRFFDGYSEEEFLCVCDIRKESKDVIQELNLAQVTVVHINAMCKNAADDKLKQCMRRYVDTHGSQATVMLISGDVNFSTELSDFRHRRKVQVILVHGPWAPEALTACAHECYSYASLVASVPFRSPTKQSQSRSCELVVNDLPPDKDSTLLQNRLRRLSDNCGGRVLAIVGTTAYLRFPTSDSARRACKRMDGEDVFGSKISVSLEAGRRRSRQDSSEHGVGAVCNPLGRQPAPRSSSCSPESSPAETSDGQPRVGTDDWDAPPTVRLASRLHSPSSRDPCAGRRRLSPRNLEQSFAILGHSGSVESPSKNVGRVSPFLLNGRKPEGFDFLVRSPSKVSPIVMSPSIWRPTKPPERNGPSVSLGAAAACLPTSWPNVYEPSHLRRTSWAPSAVSAGVVSCGSPTEASRDAVELHVTNIDRRIGAEDVKKTLLSLFREHVTVLHLSLEPQADGSVQAKVRVPSTNDARLAASKLNRRHVGHRRIHVTIAGVGGAGRKAASPTVDSREQDLRLQVTQLLGDVPKGILPFVRLREFLENRYSRSISLSDIYGLRDAVTVYENQSGCAVVLNSAVNRSSPSPSVAGECTTPSWPPEQSYCKRHESSALDRPDGWARWEKASELLPKVCISRATLGPKVHALLDGHGGSLPLNSLLTCYEAEFGPLAQQSDGEPWRQGCVPLEHLVASLPGVQVDFCPLGTKRVTWIENNVTGGPQQRPASVPVGEALEQLGREVVELLKSEPHCTMALHGFVAAYRRHFGRQCRVADYGFARLFDLLRALSGVVQVLGQGQNRLLMLTHKVQSKRFASDMLRILKAQQNKEIKMAELPDAYLRCHRRALDVADYGACFLEDLLADLAVNNSLTVVTRDCDTLVAIPRTDPLENPSAEQLENRRRFGCEVVDVLRHRLDCSVLFNKFVPAYHQHFGRQCQVVDYGVLKLAQLFSAIPDVVEVIGEGEEKQVQLCLAKRIQVEEERVTAVLGASARGHLDLQDLESAYMAYHGFPLHWRDLGANSLEEFLQHLDGTMRVNKEGRLHLVDGHHTRWERSRIVALLMEQLNGSVDVEELWLSHRSRYSTYPDMRLLRKMEADRVVCLDRDAGRIILQPLHLLCRDIISVIRQHGGVVPLDMLEEFFRRRFGVPLSPAVFNFANVAAMLSALPEYFTLRGSKKKRTVRISREHEVASAGNVRRPIADHKGAVEPELLLALRQSPVDLLGEPIPSCIPSPVICPLTADATPSAPDDLMKFEAPHEATTPFSLLDADATILPSPSPSEYEDSSASCQSFGPLSMLSTGEVPETQAIGTRPAKARIAAHFSVPLEQ